MLNLLSINIFSVFCSDVDECNADASSCDDHATCTNSYGSYNCQCISGYTGDGQTCTGEVLNGLYSYT